jgi:hypothetical protein
MLSKFFLPRRATSTAIPPDYAELRFGAPQPIRCPCRKLCTWRNGANRVTLIIVRCHDLPDIAVSLRIDRQTGFAWAVHAWSEFTASPAPVCASAERFSFLEPSGRVGCLGPPRDRSRTDSSKCLNNQPTRFRCTYARHFTKRWLDYWSWERGAAEPEVSLQQRLPCSISTVCSMVMNFDEAMPQDIYHALYKLDTSTDELAKDHSYRNGARWLLRLIDARKADYRRTHDL